MDSQQQRKFGLLTTVAMIAGIVIGSGIFFKTDDILRAVEGNVLLSSLGWVLGAVGIIFGGLTIAQYAKKEDTVGGIITYSEMAWGKTLGYLAGWFQIMFYYPALVAIIAWVAASYILVLFGAPDHSQPENSLFSHGY
jgi:basic amino acid/polyamine antiporter, APA family